MTDTRPRLGGRSAGVALVTTPAGGWLLDWDPGLATFTAAHMTWTAQGSTARFDHDLGVIRAAYPSAGALEEALGFALPSLVRAALQAEHDANPALAAPRGLDLGENEPPAGLRDLDTFPVWSSEVTAAGPDGGRTVGWGLALERDRHHHAADADLGDGTRLEVLGGRPEPSTGSTLVSYRLSQGERVVVAGDDVRAPAGADLAADDSVRALLAVIVDPDATHRGRPLSAWSTGFLEAHRDRLLDAAARPPTPYPDGTRIAVNVDGRRHRGRVAYPVLSRIGDALAYAWTPDVAALIGHPWRHGLTRDTQPERALISPAAQVTATLAGPDVAVPGPGLALAFGAVVAAAHPDSGERIQATVLRAFPDGSSGGVVYQVAAHRLDDSDAFMLPDDQLAVVQGTWWPSAAEFLDARDRAGLPVVAGELLPGGVGARHPSWLNQPSPGTPARSAVPAVTAAQHRAALLVGVDPVPSLVTVDVLGDLARVGDPDHGWMVLPAARLMDAMAKPVDQLRAVIVERAPTVALNGRESVPTLAALAVHHTPDHDPTNNHLVAVPEPLRHLRVVADNQAGL